MLQVQPKLKEDLDGKAASSSNVRPLAPKEGSGANGMSAPRLVNSQPTDPRRSNEPLYATPAIPDRTQTRVPAIIGEALFLTNEDDANAIRKDAIVEAVAPKPVNVLIGGPGGLTMRDAASLGARRVSVGGAFARAAWGGFIRSAKELIERGTFDELANAASYAELQKLFGPTNPDS